MIRLFRVFIPSSLLALILSDIVVLYTAFICGSFLLLDVDPPIFLVHEGGLLRISVVIASILAGIYFMDLYSRFRVRSRIELVQNFCVVIGIALLIQALVSYVNKGLMLPRWIMLSGCLLALVLVPAWRMIYASVGARFFGSEKVLFVGGSPIVRRIAAHLADYPELGFSSAGYLDDEAGDPNDRVLPWAGFFRDLRRVAEESKAPRIVVGLSERRHKLPLQDLLTLRLAGREIEEAGAMYEVAFTRVCVSELRTSELVFSNHLSPPRGRVFLRDVYSLLIAAAASVLLLPVMLVVAVLVKLSSPGLVFYRQTRVGLHGRPFVLYKFRSMRADAEAGTGAVWASPNDPRVTPLGRWLRRLRIDEIPQLLNVLRGEMAICGPRPERPEFVKTLSEKIPFYQQRHCVKPGITGWAQISHKYGDTLEDTITKLEYDLYYIKNMSPSLDGYIVFHTLKVMLLSRGAQ